MSVPGQEPIPVLRIGGSSWSIVSKAQRREPAMVALPTTLVPS
jgi:hypothetical protein